MIKKSFEKIQKLLIYALILSIFFIQEIKFINFSIYELIFIILSIFSLYKISEFNFRILLKTESILLILLTFFILLKYFLYREYVYPISVMLFLIIKYFFMLFLITSDDDKKTTFIILKKGLELIFKISISIILIFYILKSLGFLFESFWFIRDDVFPYLNYVTIHFKGLFSSYNYQAYIMIPGYFYVLEKTLINKKKINLIFFLTISLFIFFIVKAKVLFLIISFTFFYIFNNYIKLNKLLFYIFLTCILISYILFTHFIPSNQELFGDEYKHYFTENPVFIFDNFYIYGSLFYKIKLLIIQNIDFFQLIPPDKDFYLEHDSEPHSVYFLIIYNYGNIAIICLFLFLLNIIVKFNLLYFRKKNSSLLIDFLIIVLFLIEGINQDINSFRFFWIILSILMGSMYIIEKKR